MPYMKRLGFTMVGVGVAIMAILSFDFLTEVKWFDFEFLKITKDEEHSLSWSPLIGFGIIIIGSGVLLLREKKQ